MNREDKKEDNGTNFNKYSMAMVAASISTDEEDDFEIFPDPPHYKVSEIFPDEVIDWLPEKKEKKQWLKTIKRVFGNCLKKLM